MDSAIQLLNNWGQAVKNDIYCAYMISINLLTVSTDKFAAMSLRF